jgi:hypothetical protein
MPAIDFKLHLMIIMLISIDIGHLKQKRRGLMVFVTDICRPIFIFYFSPPMARQPLGGLGRLIFRGFAITHFRLTTLGKTPLDEGPARRRELYLTTHNTHNRQTSMPRRDSNPQSQQASGRRPTP